MAIIKKKTWPEIFEAIKSGKKRFEIRVADFKLKEGDTLILEEWDPKTKKYTGRKIEKKVGYVFRYRLDDFGQKDLIEKHGLYAIQLED
jgi:ASC-1-like (ASCH) protein